MHRFLLHNGKILDSAETTLSAGQVGLLAGWGVFSTIRVYDGILYQWDRHWRRMERDAQRLLVPFPTSPETVKNQLHRLVEKNQAWNATLRVYVVRNRGGLWESPVEKPEFDVVGFTAEVVKWPSAVKLGLIAQARHAASEFSGTKYLSWAENLTRYERAHSRGLDEAILLNERGEVAECTSANVFVVDGNRAWTPPLSDGCLAGVTRAVLLEEIHASGIEIGEKTLKPSDLESASEVFITSTTRELLPVSRIEGLNIRAGRAICDRLQQAFSENTAAYVQANRKPVPAL